jgi:acyl-CoA reductase-like NAD-dependent aldehyde dehydrogenase
MTGLPSDEHYARNLVAGRWQFPAAPYEYEIRNPADSTVTTVVPLSSRFDVARAVDAAAQAAAPWMADDLGRDHLLSQLVNAIDRHAEPLAALQSTETGLVPADSRAVLAGIVRLAQAILADHPPGALADHSSGAPAVQPAGVSGHVLSWGLPLAETICALLPQLAAGRTVVVKPSLRAPLSTVAVAYLATGVGFAPGVINVVQGTGVDVGAELHATGRLAQLHVRAGERTLAHAARATAVTGVPLRTLRAGGNVAIVGPDADPAGPAAAIVDALRVHSTGGPLSLPFLAVHALRAQAVLDAIIAGLDGCAPAPLPTEPLRQRALDRVHVLQRAGARLRYGGAVPDDVAHRMGWRLPPTVLTVGNVPGPVRGREADPFGEPLGPVLVVASWRSPDELAGVFNHPRHADGIASVWGMDDTALASAALPHPTIVPEAPPLRALHDAQLPPSWTGGVPVRLSLRRAWSSGR